MAEHEHMPVADPVDRAQTERLRRDAREAGSTSVGYFLGKAAEAPTQKERTYWLNRVDSALYFEARAKYREYLDARTRESLDADRRLVGTEATLVADRIVGNAVVLRLVPGLSTPAGGYSLVRRLAGKTGLTGYGADRNGQWVVQKLQSNATHEFAVVSQDTTAREITGPWLSVVIGTVTTREIQAGQEAEAKRQYEAAEAAEREKQRLHSERVARERRERAEAIERQKEEARVNRERMERQRIEREETHRKAVERLPFTAPRLMQFNLRDQNLPGMTLDISFRRGEDTCQMFLFKVNDTVLGDPPDGSYSGRKNPNHVYRRSVQLPRGRTSTVQVYSVTPHGNAGDPVEIVVGNSLDYRPGSGLLEFGELGGGRFGFAARTFKDWGVFSPGGRYSVAGETGTLALYESAPGDGNGILWFVSARPDVQSISIDGRRIHLERLTFRQGAGYLYRGAPPIAWPSREERIAGVGVSIQ